MCNKTTKIHCAKLCLECEASRVMATRVAYIGFSQAHCNRSMLDDAPELDRHSGNGKASKNEIAVTMYRKY